MFRRANAALMDAKVLYEALENAGGNVDAVGEIFNDLRWSDVRDLQDLQIVHQAIPRKDSLMRFSGCRLSSLKPSRCRFRKTGEASSDGCM